jgi:hypothetical protein
MLSQQLRTFQMGSSANCTNMALSLLAPLRVARTTLRSLARKL